MDPSVFGRNVQSFRKLLGLSIRELAERAGVSTRTIVKIEAGKGCTPKSEHKVALGLNVFVGRLWDESLLSTADERVISNQDGRWFFVSLDDATRYLTWLQRAESADANARVRSDPDEIQDPAERQRLGGAGLSRGFVRTCGNAFGAGFFLLNEGEIYGPDFTPPDPSNYPYIFICTSGSLKFSIRDKTYVLNAGESIVYEGKHGQELEPWKDGPTFELPCRFYLVSLKLLDLASLGQSAAREI